MTLDRPVHAVETADGPAAPAVAAPLASGFAAYGGLAQMFTPPPPDFGPLRPAGRDYLPEALAPGLLIIPWAVQAQSDPTDLARPIADGLIALEWDVSARNAASISCAARVGETLPTRIPQFADTPALRQAALTCLCVPDDGADDAGILEATGTTCSRSEEDDGTSINARVPIPGYPDRPLETPAGDAVAYPVGPRQGPQDPQVEAGHPALSVTRPPVAGDRVPVLRNRAQSHRARYRKASASCLETHSAYRSSAGLHSCNYANHIPKSTTARSHRVDSR